MVIGCDKSVEQDQEFLKLLRYFFKKTSGQVIVCPIDLKPGYNVTSSWDAEKMTNDIKSMKVKATSALNFEEAFELAQKTVDERDGLVIITGSPVMVHNYWHYKGIKKVQ
jgi:hypothetical protein